MKIIIDNRRRESYRDRLSIVGDNRPITTPWGVSPISFYPLMKWKKKPLAISPDDSPIPSKSLVRLQYAPRNPYAKTAQNFTRWLTVQYKMQRRQLRLSHPDELYCNAQWSISKREPLNRYKIAFYSFVTTKQKYRSGTLIIWYQCPVYQPHLLFNFFIMMWPGLPLLHQYCSIAKFLVI